MRICIIGCGAAGLAAARHCQIEDECVIYEQTDRLGGTWCYTDEVGTDKFGLPIHTSITNLPKEVMGYPDFPIKDHERSYVTSDEILQFLNNYAKHFDLFKYIKFNYHVQNVKPCPNGKWQVTTLNLVENQKTFSYFDAVMVCNGHYNTPLIPEIEGSETFTGETLHSHDYRHPGIFQGKSVVIIGAGPSGIDITLDVATTAKKVILSRHKNGEDVKNVFPKNVKMKFEVKKINGNKVIFEDDEIVEVDTIFYCTECGVKVEDNCVQPLYKHFIHIEHPTLCLVGLPYYVCAFSLFDLQALKGDLLLPSKSNMLADTSNEMALRKKHGLKRKQFHMMGTMQGDYYEELAKLGGLDPLPAVMAELHNFASRRHLDDVICFRNDNYKILNGEQFLKIN